MPRLIRNALVLLKVETTAGVDAAPTPAANSMLMLTGCDFQPDFATVDREVSRPYLGSSPSMAGRRIGRISNLRIELAGPGAAVAPAWAPVLRAMGMAEAALSTPTRVEYTPVSTGFTTLTAWVYGDGALYKMTYCLGTGTLDFSVSQTPKLIASIQGLYSSESTGSFSTPDFSAFKAPVVLAPPSVTTDITIGCTYATGALTGGSAFSSKGISIDVGNDVRYVDLCTNPYMTIGARSMRATFTLDQTAAQEVQSMADVKNAVLTGLGFKIGSGTGNQILIHAPKMQQVNPKVVDDGGVRLMQYEGILTPDQGNDEFRLVVL